MLIRGGTLSDTFKFSGHVVPDCAAGLEPRVIEHLAGRWLLFSDHGAAARRNMTIAWSCVAVLIVADAIWLPNSRMSFAASNWTGLLTSGLYAAIACAFFVIVTRRLRNETDRIALFLRSALEKTELAWRCLILITALLIAGVTFSYLATAAGWPLRDGMLAEIDRALGFHWPDFLGLTNSVPLLAKLLMRVYDSTAAMSGAVIVWLALGNRGERLAEFIAIVSLTVVGLSVAMLAAPAAGAFAFYQPPPRLYASFAGAGEMWSFSREFALLRNGAISAVDLAAVQGIVSFPSFHTILAIITVYPLRETRWLMVAMMVLNGIMIVSTLPVGGHHLSDVLAGAVIAIGAIAIVHRVSVRAA